MNRGIQTLTLALAVAITAPAFAAPGHQDTANKILQEGISSTQQLASTSVRYQVPVDRAGKLYLSSEHLASDSGQSMVIEAALYNSADQLLATDTDNSGHFMITEDVTPGQYYLEIKGSALGSANESNSRYNIHMGFE